MRKILLGLLAALAFAAPSFSRAATITGFTAYAQKMAYALISTNLQYPDGTPYSDLPVMLICLDHTTQAPFDRITTFFTEAGGTALKGGSGNAGIAAVHWLLDNYYVSYFKDGNSRQQKALQYALWEIGNDYNGNPSSIHDNTGSSRPGSGNDVDFPLEHADYLEFVSAYQTLYQAMTTAFATLPSTYRSTTFTLDLFTNQDPGLQSMVAIIERAPPNVVPTAVPTITGPTHVGSTVTGTYTYADSNSDIENPSGTIYHFVTSTNSTITGSSGGTVVATGSTGGAASSVPYTLQPADLNKYLYYCVTPAAQTGASPGLEVCTVASGPVTSAAVPQTRTPTAVPSLGQWSLMALMSLLALFGMSRVRQRKI